MNGHDSAFTDWQNEFFRNGQPQPITGDIRNASYHPNRFAASPFQPQSAQAGVAELDFGPANVTEQNSDQQQNLEGQHQSVIGDVSNGVYNATPSYQPSRFVLNAFQPQSAQAGGAAFAIDPANITSQISDQHLGGQHQSITGNINNGVYDTTPSYRPSRFVMNAFQPQSAQVGGAAFAIDPANVTSQISDQHLAGQHQSITGDISNGVYDTTASYHPDGFAVSPFQPQIAQTAFDFGAANNIPQISDQNLSQYIHLSPPLSPKSLNLPLPTSAISANPNSVTHQTTGASVQSQQPLRQNPTPGISRDRSAPIRRPSLAATHPAHYNSHPPSQQGMMPPPPLPPSLFRKDLAHLATPPPSNHTSPAEDGPASPAASRGLPTGLAASPAPADPYRDLGGHGYYADPTRQTSTALAEWGPKNFRPLRADTLLYPGNVMSPVHMIGLPFGGMVEMAFDYASLEEQQSAEEG